MRISDWSSDVCSSDLAGEERGEVAEERDPVARQVPFVKDVAGGANRRLQMRQRLLAVGFPGAAEIGRSGHGAPLLPEVEPRKGPRAAWRRWPRLCTTVTAGP